MFICIGINVFVSTSNERKVCVIVRARVHKVAHGALPLYVTSGGSRGGPWGPWTPLFEQKKNFFKSKIEVNAVILYVGSHLRLRLGLGRGDLADES